MTQIETIKYRKLKRVVLVSLSDGRSLELDMDLVLEYTLKKQMDLSDEIIEEIESKQAIISAKQDAYTYASYRLRSEWQVRHKLEGKQYPHDLIDRCIDFLKDFNLIDDDKFASAYIKETLLKKQDGPLKIKMKLRSFGVPDNICDNAVILHYPFDKEEEFATKSSLKKMRLISGKPLAKQKPALFNYLQAKGFSVGATKKAMAKIFKNGRISENETVN